MSIHRLISTTLATILGFSILAGIPVYAQESNAKQAVLGVENRVSIYEKDMYTNIHANEIVSTLAQFCSKKNLDSADLLLQKFKRVVDSKYSSYSNAKVLDDSYKLYELISMLQEKKLDSYDGDAYCKIKYVLVLIQDRLRDKHIGIMEESGIIEDFNGYTNFSTISGYAIKLETIETQIRTYQSYIARSGGTYAYKIINPGFLNGLSQEQKNLLNKSESLLKAMLGYSLFNLKSAGVIDQTDIDMIDDKIFIEYVQKCDIFNGKYEIRQTLDGKGNHIQYDTLGLTLKVNFCPNYFVVRDLSVIYEKIITHELGHHVYYYKDENPDRFEMMCREGAGNSNRKNDCSSDDFVTPYAERGPAEDYAEHFMHQFLGTIDKNSPMIRLKSQYMSKLYGI